MLKILNFLVVVNKNKTYFIIVLLLLILIGFPIKGVNAVGTHPRLLMNTKELTLIQNKASSNTADWQKLKAQCDSLVNLAVDYVDISAQQSSYAKRGKVLGSGAHGGSDIGAGDYFGGMYYNNMYELSTCYIALNPTDPTTAATYLAQAKNILTAISQPPLTMTRQSDGMVRIGHSVDISGNDLITGSTITVYSPRNIDFVVGDVVTISGAQGCSSMNSTWKISSKNTSNYYFTNIDGSAAPTIDANCTLYSYNPNGDSGFGTRFYVAALAIGYDWLNSQLSAQQKNDAIVTMNEYLTEVGRIGYGLDASEQNYFAGYFWGLVSAYIATDGDNASMSTWYTNKIASLFTGPHMLRDYHNLWLSGGGYGEGLQAYGYGSIRAVTQATLAMKMYGIDWTQPPYNFPFVDDQMKYFMGFTTPTKLALDDNEYIYSMGSTENGVRESAYIPLGLSALLSSASREFSSSYATKFQDWYNTVYAKMFIAAGKYSPTSAESTIPAWDIGVYKSRPDLVYDFLYSDPSAATSDWTVLPLLYRGWSGNYGVTRTDRTDNATEVTLLGGPSIGAAGNGKTQFNSGSITIQRGNDRLLVYGLGEASRSYDIIDSTTFNNLHNERDTYGNKKNSIFWAGPTTSETKNQGLTSRIPPPGHIFTTTSWGSSIDRASDATDYTYMRAVGLEANNALSIIDVQYHQLGWDRELLFLRPKLIVVHDRTTVKNSTDDRAMLWTFGRNITQTTAPSGMVRYDASSNGIYRGAFTSVLPTSANVSVVDHDNLHYLYRAEVRPSSLGHATDNWLAVFDTATSSPDVNIPVSLTATNVDAVQFNDARNSVVAFPQLRTPVLPITYQFSGTMAQHYIVGLAISTTYNVAFSGNTVTIATSGSGMPVTSDSAGVLEFSLGVDSANATYTVGGTISGLTGTIVLQNNGGDTLSTSVNGSFTFASGLSSGSTYNVSVITQPSGQACAVTNGNGTIYSTNMTSVSVICGDNVAPIISSISTSTLSVSSATIVWTTNENSNSQIDYGLTSSYGNTSNLNSTLVTSHVSVLSYLIPNTTYHFRVKSTDAFGNLATSADQTFKTLVDSTSPSTPPLTLSAVSSTEIDLSWSPSTDDVGVVGYKIYRGSTQIGTTTTGTTYQDTSLSPSTSYSYNVSAYDASDNVSPLSVTSTISTQAVASSGEVSITSGGGYWISNVTPPSNPFLQPTVNSPQNLSSISLTTTLSIGSKGNEVTTLQQFLITQGYLTDIQVPTGYYGLATQSAVEKFQCDKNIICSGTVDSSGYGMVGKMTRNVLSNLGATALPTSNTSTTNIEVLKKQVTTLTELLGTLLTKVHSLQGITPQTSTPFTTTTTANTSGFYRDLSLHMAGEDVKLLQEFLNTHSFVISQTGEGSPGHEGNTFGLQTYSALKAYQTYVGLPSTGFFGVETRGYVKGIIK